MWSSTSIVRTLSLLIIVAIVNNAIDWQLDERQMHHLFGVKRKEDVPEHWFDHPSKRVDNHGQHYYDVTIDNQLYRFNLQPNSRLLSDGFHSVLRDNTLSADMTIADQHCIYTGRSISHNGSRVSLVGCGQKSSGRDPSGIPYWHDYSPSQLLFQHGLIIAANGDFYLIQPIPTDISNERTITTSAHVIHKRAIDDHMMHYHSNPQCLFDIHDDPYPYQQKQPPIDIERLAIDGSNSLTIELGVFADDAMWTHFRRMYGGDADAELQRFILATVNNIDLLYGHKSISPKINVKIARYEVMKTAPPVLDKNAHLNGEVDRLLEAFCEYQNEINPADDDDPRHWDHALLFSGYDLYRGTLQSVAGYAPVKGMCSGIRSCTINEGLDFGSVFVVTHEMGHSLGMYHDGDNGCDLRCCIMSPSVGTGKTAWSECSVRELNAFVGSLGTGLRPPNCLLDSGGRKPIRAVSSVGQQPMLALPGQLYTIDQQCMVFHGDCWKNELRDTQTLQNVCEMVWCGSGEGIIRTAHPALEGTHCGSGKWCIEGVCTSHSDSSKVAKVDGEWAAWNDAPSTGCATECNEQCSIGGQLRVRRSVRLCNNPAPNNGGRECVGDSTRAIICQSEPCSGPSSDEFATEVCRELRENADTPDLQLSGHGFQYEQIPCKIWCHMQVNNFIRTVANFPDGTPCGSNSYCIKGECRKLSCNNQALVESDRECPVLTKTTDNSNELEESERVVVVADQKPSLQLPQVSDGGVWTEWQSWSRCSAWECNSHGTRSRTRKCKLAPCYGASFERNICNGACNTTAKTLAVMNNTLAAWAPWSAWMQCDVVCGSGQQIRRRACSGGGTCGNASTESRSCTSIVDCVDLWTEWSEWSACSRTCNRGLQVQRRRCLAEACVGASAQSRQCQVKQCVATEAEWTVWQSWSTCSASCGTTTGTRNRRRICPRLGTCIGQAVQAENCTSSVLTPCPIAATVTGGSRRNAKSAIQPLAAWGAWSEWSRCSRTCGDDGVERRTRQCSSVVDRCNGAPFLFRVCTSVQPCPSSTPVVGSTFIF